MLLFPLVCWLMGSCGSAPNIDKDLSGSYYDALAEKELRISADKVQHWVTHYATANYGRCEADRYLRKYYKNGGSFVWVDYNGVKASADSLLAVLDSVSLYGLDKQNFYVSTLRKEISRYRNLDFHKPDDINKSVAKIEFYLSKAMLRYVSGQRFGFINPNSILNDSVKVSDLPIVRPRKDFFAHALSLAGKGSIMALVNSSKPTSEDFYALLKERSAIPSTDSLTLQKYLIAIERTRWKYSADVKEGDRYVVVNIPAYRLWAISPDSTINMKVVCGSSETPTPLLASQIERIDLNPRWLIPHSIVKKSLLHVGTGYLKSRHMYFIDKKTGKRLDYATPEQRLAGSVNMVQEGGEGNSLGRIIFRFKNNFAVYLHSTNAPWAFDSDKRDESHGCVRVAQPYSLACLVADCDEEQAQKLWYSLTYDTETPDKSMLLHNIKLKRKVPVLIDYQTLFKSPQTNRWITYDDIYGYDKKLFAALKYWLN